MYSLAMEVFLRTNSSGTQYKRHNVLKFLAHCWPFLRLIAIAIANSRTAWHILYPLPTSFQKMKDMVILRAYSTGVTLNMTFSNYHF